MRRSQPLAALVASMALAAPGCMERTVKPMEHRVLTSEEAAQASAQHRAKKAEAAASSKPAPHEPQTVEELRAQSEKEPGNPKWHYLLGFAYEDQGRFELAELRYRRGAELLQKDTTGPHYVLGRVLAKESKWGEALKELSKAVLVKPADPEGYYLDPAYRESYYITGWIHFKLHHTTESEQAFRSYLRLGGERSHVVEYFPELIAE